MIMKTKILKQLVIIIVTAALVLTGIVPSYAEEKTYEGAGNAPDTTATSVILMDAGSGEVLYEKNAHEKRDPASITKILNCLVCLDKLDLKQEVTVDMETTTEGSTMELKKGETIKIKDIMYGMMLVSANDGAEYLGYLAGEGDIDVFCDMMNAKARQIGAKDTKYVNPNGLNNESVNNVTTAYDIALMVKEGMKDKRFRKIVSTRKYVIPATNKSKKRKLTNSNRCLWDDEIVAASKGDKAALDNYAKEYKKYLPDDSEVDVRKAAKQNAKLTAALMYKPCIGVKTGYTSTAGDCFAGIAKKGNTEIIAIVLNAPHSRDKFQDARKLWNYGYANFKTYTAQEKDDFKFDLDLKRGELREVAVGIREDLDVTMLKGENPEETVTTEIELIEKKPMAPIRKGAVVGRLVAYDNGKEVASQDMVSLETSEAGGILSYIGIADEDRFEFFVLLAALLFVLYKIATRKNSKAKRRRERRKRRRERIRRDNDLNQFK